jgi:hypothetical protein
MVKLMHIDSTAQRQAIQDTGTPRRVCTWRGEGNGMSADCNDNTLDILTFTVAPLTRPGALT